MNKILVPTDFSPNSLIALTYASEIAQRSGGEIHLINVIEPTLNMATMQSDSTKANVVKERLEKIAIESKTASRVFSNLKVYPHILAGDTINSILNYTEKEAIDLIVMGTTGASGLKEIFMGSIASGVVGKSKVPVLTIPAAYEHADPEEMIFATNNFEKSKTILDNIIKIARLFSATIFVVVFRDMDGPANADLIYNEEQINDYLKYLKDLYPDVNFKGKLLEGKDFENEIDIYSNQKEVDIIAMVTYPKTLLEKIFKRSVTKKMVSHSTLPILAIPYN